MSTSVRIDTSEWISGCVLVGDTGGGVLGSSIPSGGINGAGYVYNDLSLPADAGKEICGRITTWPSAGTLFANEDTSFTFSAPDGTYTFQYQLYVDYVAVGSPATVTINIGGGGATVNGQTLTTTASVIAGSASGTVNASVSGQTLTIAASLVPGTATGSGSAAVSGQTVTVNLSLSAGSASGTGGATVVGQTLISNVALLAGAASSNNPGDPQVPQHVATTISLGLDALFSQAMAIGAADHRIRYEPAYVFTDGAGAGQINKLYIAKRTIAASSAEDLDLAGGLTNAYGDLLIFTKIRGLIVRAAPGNTNNVIVGGASSNQFASWAGGGTHTLTVRPGGMVALIAPDSTGFGVTAGTGDLLRIANSSSGSSVTYDILVLGSV